jgi:hypothetical protein
MGVAIEKCQKRYDLRLNTERQVSWLYTMTAEKRKGDKNRTKKKM